MNWTGVMPAITTCFRLASESRFRVVAEHSAWMLDSGCTAIIALGSLGEGATLSFDEKLQVIDACMKRASG